MRSNGRDEMRGTRLRVVNAGGVRLSLGTQHTGERGVLRKGPRELSGVRISPGRGTVNRVWRHKKRPQQKDTGNGVYVAPRRAVNDTGNMVWDPKGNMRWQGCLQRRRELLKRRISQQLRVNGVWTANRTRCEQRTMIRNDSTDAMRVNDQFGSRATGEMQG